MRWGGCSSINICLAAVKLVEVVVRRGVRGNTFIARSIIRLHQSHAESRSYSCLTWIVLWLQRRPCRETSSTRVVESLPQCGQQGVLGSVSG